jgi:hypothetical protein
MIFHFFLLLRALSRQFGVMVERRLLAASSFRDPRGRLLRADTAAATRRTCVRERAATVVKRLATRFSLGAFAGRFEETPLGAVRKAVGKGPSNTRATLVVASIGCVIGARSIDYGSCPAER